MANFWNALSQAGPAAVQGYQAQNDRALQQRQQAEMERQQQIAQQAEQIRGRTLMGMFQPQMPGAVPMPQTMNRPNPTALAPQAPGSSSLGSSMPGPETTQRPMPTQIGQGQGFESPMTAQANQPSQQLDWKTILTTIARENPGADPQAIAGAVEKFVPLMNSQSQMEWKQLQMAFKDRQMQATQDYRGNRIDLDRDKLNATVDYRAKRIAQIDRGLDLRPPPTERMAPAQKAKLDSLQKGFLQADTSMRTAQTNLQRAYLSYNQKNIAKAQADVDTAIDAAEAASQAYTSFVDSLQGGTTGMQPETTPAASAGPALTPGNAKIITTKTGNKAQASGYESPEMLGTRPPEAKGAPQARVGEVVPNKTSVVSAQPNNQGKQPALKAPPLDAKMRKTSDVYQSPRVGPVQWTGTGWVRVQWDGKNWTPVKK